MYAIIAGGGAFMTFYKLFCTYQDDSTLKSIPEPNRKLNNNTVAYQYSFERPNEYLELISKITNHGLDQVIFTPSDYKKIMKNAVYSKAKIINIEFNEDLEEEEQEKINKWLGMISDEQFYQKIVKELEKLYQYDIFPKKLTLRINGNKISLQNNGVAYLQEDCDIQHLSNLI